MSTYLYPLLFATTLVLVGACAWGYVTYRDRRDAREFERRYREAEAFEAAIRAPADKVASDAADKMVFDHFTDGHGNDISHLVDP